MKYLALSLMTLSSASAFALSPVPPAPPSTNLQVYDACQETWIDTGVPFRAEPTFPDHAVSERPYRLGASFRIGDETFRLYDVDLYNLEKHHRGGGSNVPKSLRGLWWMDGNPVPEVVTSLANAVYDETTGTLTSRYNNEDSYIFSPTLLGLATWDIFYTVKGQLTIRNADGIDFENPSFGDKIYADFNITLGPIQFKNLPTTFVSEGHWRRDTGPNCYNFRQIVDENGVKLPVYDYFVKQTKAQTKKLGGRNGDVLVQPRLVK